LRAQRSCSRRCGRAGTRACSRRRCARLAAARWRSNFADCALLPVRATPVPLAL
jgi:hypothetical protein